MSKPRKLYRKQPRCRSFHECARRGAGRPAYSSADRRAAAHNRPESGPSCRADRTPTQRTLLPGSHIGTADSPQERHTKDESHDSSHIFFLSA